MRDADVVPAPGEPPARSPTAELRAGSGSLVVSAGFADPPATVAFDAALQQLGATPGGKTQELLGSREGLAAVLQVATDGITVTDAASRLVYVNTAAARMLGFSSADALVSMPTGHIWQKIQPVNDHGEPLAANDLPTERALRGEDLPEVLIRFRVIETADDRWLLVRTGRIRDGAGTCLAVVTSFRDVSALKRREAGFRLLARASAALASSLEERAVLHAFGAVLVPELADFCAVDLARDDALSPVMTVRADGRPPSAVDGPARAGLLERDRGATLAALRTGKPLLFRDLGGGPPPCPPAVDALGAAGMRSAIVAPLVGRDRLLGALTLALSGERRRFDGFDVDLIADLATRISASLHNHELYRELHDSEERARLLLDSVDEGIYGIDLDGRCTLANAASVRMLGVGCVEELLGRDMNAVMHGPEAAASRIWPQCRIADALARGEHVSIEDDLLWRADGTAFSASRTAHPVYRDQKLVGAVVVFSDITARKRAQQLEAQRTALTSAVNLALAGAADAREMLEDCAWAIVRNLGATEVAFWVGEQPASLALAARAGFASAALPTEHARAVFGPATVCGHERQEEIAFNSDAERTLGAVDAAAAAWARQEGITAFAALPLVIGARNLGVMAVFSRRRWDPEVRDLLATAAHTITIGLDRRRAEEERASLLAELQDRDRRKDEFLAMLSHELRNPLAPIVTALRVLRMRRGNREPEHDVLERQVGQLVRLVDDLLDVSRITRGKIELRREPLDLRAVVERALETARPLIETHEHELTVTLPPEPLVVNGDPVRLAQILANLLNNAAKYTNRGGHVRLAAARDGESVAVTVSDDGVGIPRELLSRIFDVFVQGEQSLDRAHGGLGLGLTLVRSLVTLHGGTVQAESPGTGRGSTFTVRLPVVVRPERQGEAPGRLLSAPPVQGAVRRRVLVVDDNEDAAELLGQAVEMWGHDVRVALNGLQAIELARPFDPDIILLDIGLPGMDGYAVAASLRALRIAPHARLVALSGYGQEADRQRSRAAGFSDHLVKPVDLETLEAVLRRDYGHDGGEARVT